YYNADELRTYDQTFFFGCSRTSRMIIDKKNIDKKEYVYGNYNKLFGWRASEKQQTPPLKAKLLLTKKWVIDNMQSMTQNNDDEHEICRNKKVDGVCEDDYDGESDIESDN